MAQNDFLVVAQTTNGDTSRIIRAVDEQLRKLDFAYSAHTAWEKMRGGGRMMRPGTQRFEVFHQFPFNRLVEVTAAALAGATTISVKDSSFIRKNMELFDRGSSQTIQVTADPVSATSITVAALAKDVANNATLHGMYIQPGESWQRPKPVGRATESHFENISTAQISGAISWHMSNTRTYGQQEEARLRMQTFDERRRAINYGLLFDDAKDGTSDGKYKSEGLFFRGIRNNRVIVNGDLTIPDLNKAIYSLVRNSLQRNPLITLHCAQDFINQTSAFPLDVATFRTKMDDTQLGVGEAQLRTPMNNRFEWSPDPEFDGDQELRETLIAVNWDNLRPTELAEPLIELPTPQRPQGVADNGSGDKQWMITETFGLASEFPIGSVMVFTGVKRIRP